MRNKCEQPAKYFADKTDWIWADLDSGFDLQNIDSLGTTLRLAQICGKSLTLISQVTLSTSWAAVLNSRDGETEAQASLESSREELQGGARQRRGDLRNEAHLYYLPLTVM